MSGQVDTCLPEQRHSLPLCLLFLQCRAAARGSAQEYKFQLSLTSTQTSSCEQRVTRTVSLMVHGQQWSSAGVAHDVETQAR